MKIAVMTDTTACVTEEMKEKYDIHVIPLNVVFGEESFQESVDMTLEEFEEKLVQSEKLPKTSQPAIGLFVEMYEKLAGDYDAIISIHLSSGISGTYQAAKAAAEMVPQVKIEVFDTEISSNVQRYYVLEAVDMVAKGFELNEIMEELYNMHKTTQVYFMVDDLKHLQRGGRLSAAGAFVGSLLKVKPILYFVDKKIVPFEKVRTTKRALARIISLLEEDIKVRQIKEVSIVESQQAEAAERLKKELEEKHPDLKVSIGEFTPVLLTHLGQGTIGIGWY